TVGEKTALLEIRRSDLREPRAIVALVADGLLSRPNAFQHSRYSRRLQLRSLSHRLRDLVTRRVSLLARALGERKLLVAKPEIALDDPRADLGPTFERVLDVALAGQHVAGGVHRGGALQQQASVDIGVLVDFALLRNSLDRLRNAPDRTDGQWRARGLVLS